MLVVLISVQCALSMKYLLLIASLQFFLDSYVTNRSPWMKQLCQVLLLVRKLRNNALIFGYFLLFPSVPSTPRPTLHSPLQLGRTNIGEHKVTWRYFFCMHTIRLTFFFFPKAIFSVCLLPVLPFVASRRWSLPNTSGHLAIKAVRWSAGLGVGRPGLSLWLFNCLWLGT